LKNNSDRTGGAEKKPFVKPELKALDVRGTKTGGAPDPNEFNPFLQKTS
jgi:hypothetical protein